MNPDTMNAFITGTCVGFVGFLVVARIMVAIEDRQRRAAKRAMGDLQDIFQKAKKDVDNVIHMAHKKMDRKAGRVR